MVAIIVNHVERNQRFPVVRYEMGMHRVYLKLRTYWLKPTKTLNHQTFLKRSIPGELTNTDAYVPGSQRTYDDWETSGAETVQSEKFNRKHQNHSTESNRTSVVDGTKSAQFYSHPNTLRKSYQILNFRMSVAIFFIFRKESDGNSSRYCSASWIQPAKELSFTNYLMLCMRYFVL